MTSDPRKKTLDQYLKETFTPEFLERAAKEYQDAKVEGLNMELEKAHDKILELHGKVKENEERATRYNNALKHCGLLPEGDLLDHIRKIENDGYYAQVRVRDMKVLVRNALRSQFVDLLRVAGLEIVYDEDEEG